MKLLIATIATLASACAVTTMPSTRDVSPRAPHATLSSLSVTTAEPAPWFPAPRSEPRLPSADRLRTQLRGDGHEQLSATVRICVAPDGSTYDFALRDSSGVAAFDRAVVRDVAGWQYASFHGPTGSRVCERVALTYTP